MVMARSRREAASALSKEYKAELERKARAPWTDPRPSL